MSYAAYSDGCACYYCNRASVGEVDDPDAYRMVPACVEHLREYGDIDLRSDDERDYQSLVASIPTEPEWSWVA